MEKILEIENEVSMQLAKKAYPAKKAPARPGAQRLTGDEIVEVGMLTIELPVSDEIAELFAKGVRVRKTMQDLREVEKPDIRRGLTVVRMVVDGDNDVELIIDIRTEVQEKKNKP
jgi:hypothetical protein